MKELDMNVINVNRKQYERVIFLNINSQSMKELDMKLINVKTKQHVREILLNIKR